MTDVTSPFGTYALSAQDAQLLRWAQKMPVGWFGRRTALILRKAVLMRSLAVIDALVEGLKLRLYMQDNVSERKFLFMPQFFDYAERQLLKKMLKPGDIFIDIGANAGIYSLTAAALVGDAGRVIAIEPNPAVLERLKFNMALNGFQSRIVLEQAAVSDREGSFDLVLDQSNLGGASLVAERSDVCVTVLCHRLYSIVAKYQIGKIRAMKIDIEGAEDRALIPYLKEAPETLRPELIILENSVKEWTQDLPAALAGAGYNLQATTRMNMIWTRVT